jgi:hypothetical protein
MSKKSTFERVKNHLLNKGCDTMPPAVIADDVETLVRRCNDVRSLGREYGDVELSPYMASLLRVSRSAPAMVQTVGVQAAASV